MLALNAAHAAPTHPEGYVAFNVICAPILSEVSVAVSNAAELTSVATPSAVTSNNFNALSNVYPPPSSAIARSKLIIVFVFRGTLCAPIGGVVDTTCGGTKFPSPNVPPPENVFVFALKSLKLAVDPVVNVNAKLPSDRFPWMAFPLVSVTLGVAFTEIVLLSPSVCPAESDHTATLLSVPPNGITYVALYAHAPFVVVIFVNSPVWTLTSFTDIFPFVVTDVWLIGLSNTTKIFMFESPPGRFCILSPGIVRITRGRVVSPPNPPATPWPS